MTEPADKPRTPPAPALRMQTPRRIIVRRTRSTNVPLPEIERRFRGDQANSWLVAVLVLASAALLIFDAYLTVVHFG